MLLYEAVTMLIFFGIESFLHEIDWREWEVPLSSAGALIAAIPLYGIYRMERICRIRCYEEGQEDGQPEPFGRTAGYDAGSLILLTLFGACLSVLMNMVVLELPVSWEDYEAVGAALYTPPVPVQMLCAGLIIPLTEELVFRGLCYYRMRNLLPMLPAVLISGVYFGIYHGNVVQGIYASVIGFFCAGMMEWYGTLAAAYLVHASANMMSVLVTNTYIGELIGEHHLVRMILIPVLAVWTFLLLNMIRKDNRNR